MGFLNEYYTLYQKLDSILEKYFILEQQNEKYQALCLKKDYEEVLGEISFLNDKAREKQPIFEKHLSLSKEEKVLEFAITSRIEIKPNVLQKNLNKETFTFVYLQELPLKKALYSNDLKDFGYIKQYILRLLQLSPLNALHFTLIDPKTLGVSFNFLRPILDNEFIYKQRILTYEEEIEEALLSLANYMENLLQRQLCGVESYVEYNAKNPKPLPLKVLVINGLGIKVFSSLALLCLRRLIKFSHLVGINIFIIIDDESLKNKEKSDLFDCIDFLNKHGEKLGSLGGLSSLKHLVLKRVLEPEPTDRINMFLEEINTAYKQTSCIKGELKELLKEKDFLKRDSTLGLKIPLAWDLCENEMSLNVGFMDSEPHTIIGGRSGSGKSNLLNVLIASACFYYSRDELEVYLLDYKDGVEFNLYTEPNLSQAKLIAINSNVSYGLSVLEYIQDERIRRSSLFKKAGSKVSDYISYREHTRKKLPRILIIIDEFQTLFSTKDRDKIEDILVDIVRKGRSFGIHLVLSTQTLSGIEMNNRAQILGQIGNRLALVMSEEDSFTLLGGANNAASKLKGKPYGLFNFNGGQMSYNKEVKIPYANKNEIATLLERIKQNHNTTHTKIYDGDKLYPIDESVLGGDELNFILGKGQDFENKDFKLFTNRKHLLLSTTNAKEKELVFKHLSLNVRACCYEIKEINDETSLKELEGLLSYQKGVIFIKDLDTCKDLLPSDSFSFDPIDETKTKHEVFKEILKHSAKNLVCVVACINKPKRLLNNSQYKEFFEEIFSLRLGFELDAESVGVLMNDVYLTKSLRHKNALFMDLDNEIYRYFKLFKEKA
ncbi:FtsK/SpoIIIE domain-containing protein [Helicobacter cetorum]|uniref:FtsK/SpoIIIE domain-containing protein n=1 Tax=Helicobacter cetorum TaxID=138563 RepID=UPI000CF0F930|nr:FtsK/SpoIIIE domain-containing protein [Helicobacter cetorum]